MCERPGKGIRDADSGPATNVLRTCLESRPDCNETGRTGTLFFVQIQFSDVKLIQWPLQRISKICVSRALNCLPTSMGNLSGPSMGLGTDCSTV